MSVSSAYSLQNPRAAYWKRHHRGLVWMRQCCLFHAVVQGQSWTQTCNAATPGVNSNWSPPCTVKLNYCVTPGSTVAQQSHFRRIILRPLLDSNYECVECWNIKMTKLKDIHDEVLKLVISNFWKYWFDLNSLCKKKRDKELIESSKFIWIENYWQSQRYKELRGPEILVEHCHHTICYCLRIL